MLEATTARSAPLLQPVAPGRALAVVTPQRAAVATFLFIMAAMLVAVGALTGGHVVYSHDDPYIHVAMAERLVRGHYGVNLGEVTSPSSSVIWPFLLIPGAGTSLHVYLPLLWNAMLGAATAWLMGRYAGSLPLSAEFRHAAAFRVALACLLVLAVNLVGLAWTGLEHNLQVLVAAAVAIALVEHMRGAALPTWALAFAALGPAVRYEMLAVTAAVVLVLLLEQRWRTMLLVGGASLALPGLLALFLVINGNYPLPNSVMAKLMPASVVAQVASEGGTGIAPSGWALIELALSRLWMSSFGGKLVMLGIMALLVWRWLPATGARRIVLTAALAAAALHMAVGQFGWFYRYEIYAVAFCGLIAIAALAEHAPRAVLPLVAATAMAYLPPILQTPHGALNVHQQQFQMHRFVAEHWRKPFAVNDLGFVSLGLARDRIYVLDLWGLASNEAVRQKSKTPAWLDDVTRRHGTGLAMVYSSYFPKVPASWTKVAELRFDGPVVTVADRAVGFYATAVGDRAELTTRLRAFAATLPKGVTLQVD